MMNKKVNYKKLIICLLIPIVALFLHSFVNTVASLICLYTDNEFSIDTNVTALIAYILYIIIFGTGYHFILSPKKNSEKKHYSSLNFFLILIVVIVMGFLLQLLVSTVLNIINLYAPELLESYNNMVKASFSLSNGFIRVVTVVLVAPIGEELAFRGLTLNLSNDIFSKKAPLQNSHDKSDNIKHTHHAGSHSHEIFAVIFSSLLFGLYHGNVVQFCYAFAVGIILAAVTLWFSSLLPGVILHISINASAYLISFLGIPMQSFLILLISIIIITALMKILNLLSNHTKLP